MTATAPEATVYEVEGRLLEVCTCNTLCPCWVGEDPDGGTCDSVLAWYIDSGTVRGVDVSDRMIALSVHIPGNVLAGNWKAVVYVDDRCTEDQQSALLQVFTGELGGAIADLAALVGEVVAVERAPVSFTVTGGEGLVKIGDVAEARLSPFRGATGETTALYDTVFTTIPGSPAYPGKAEMFRRDGSGHGLSDVELSGRNSIQGSFRFSA
ncbi:MAG TPA: DUF1326 domain-containing protein [Jiangellaceae bacterium]